MRKRMIDNEVPAAAQTTGGWLNLVQLATAELSSEDRNHPLEAALGTASQSGWRAAEAGPQTIRLLFDEPLHIRRIRLVFRETEQSRTQEFALKWSPDGATYHEIVRQQYNFSPTGATEQIEEYQVDLAGLTALELYVVPDIGGGPAHAALAALQMA